MSIFERFLSILTPYECLSCSSEGDLLCADCIQQLTILPERCYRCLKPSELARTCTDCGLTSNLRHVWVGTAYSGIAKELVLKLKFAGAQAVSRQMAARLMSLLSPGHKFTIVPVPTATDRVRGRGYDQAKLLGRELSRAARLPYLDCLARSGHTHQVGSSRGQRLRQLQRAFRVTKPAYLAGLSVLLIDDVLTTGATLETAAKVLIDNGAADVSAIVFAQA